MNRLIKNQSSKKTIIVDTFYYQRNKTIVFIDTKMFILIEYFRQTMLSDRRTITDQNIFAKHVKHC